jgi:hypothetical protein
MIQVTQGENFTLTCKFLKNINQPVDLTGWTIKSAIRVNSDSGNVLLEGTINIGSNGVFTTSFDQTTTILPEGKFVVSIRIEASTGSPRFTLNEPILVKKDQNW